MRTFSKKFIPNIQRNAVKKLWMIDAAPDINLLRVPPPTHLEPLSGNRKGQHCIRINNQWRICFVWKENNAYDVEITDYHQEK